MSKSSKVEELKTKQNTSKEDKEMEKVAITFPIADLPKLLKPSISAKRKIIAIYPYRDEKDMILYEIIRQREGQPYLCRRPTDDGEYEYSIKEVRKVIYNLPRIIKAMDNKEIIFITEGESKVDTLTELGIPATTAPFTSPSKWNSYYNSFLEGIAGVVILQDDDQNGIDFANNTYSVLREILPEEKVGIMPITDICPDIDKQGADITDVRDFMRDDERLKLILESIASQI